MPDPKLKLVAAEIQAVLEKHDVAGWVALSSKTHSEYVYVLSPTWSAITVQQVQEGAALRLKSLAKDYPDKATQKKHLEDTIGSVLGLMNLAERAHRDLMKLAKMAGEKMDITHIDRLE